MSFETNERRMAFAPESLTEFPGLLAQYGEEACDGEESFRTILCHWDDTAKTRIRAGSFPGTVVPTPLFDGRLCVSGLWQADLAAAFDSGAVTFAQQLTDEEFTALTVPPEPEPPEPSDDDEYFEPLEILTDE